MKSLNYGDNMQDPPDYNEIVYWLPVESDSDMGESTKFLTPLATRMIKDIFSKTLLPKKQKSVNRKFPHQNNDHTKCPKLDPAIK